MVSISNFGQVFNNTQKFNANELTKTDNKDLKADKEKLNAFAKSQINLGYVTMGAGALALIGTQFKKGAFKLITAIPAAGISAMLGANMIAGGQGIQKAINNIQNKTEQTNKVDTKA